jgi:hypothetical protein
MAKTFADQQASKLSMSYFFLPALNRSVLVKVRKSGFRRLRVSVEEFYIFRLLLLSQTIEIEKIVYRTKAYRRWHG